MLYMIERRPKNRETATGHVPGTEACLGMPKLFICCQSMESFPYFLP